MPLFEDVLLHEVPSMKLAFQVGKSPVFLVGDTVQIHLQMLVW